MAMRAALGDGEPTASATSEKVNPNSTRRITISTVGVVPSIERLMDEDLNVNLALSLHAPNQHIRKKIVPYARKFELNDVLRAARMYAAKSKRDITYEYVMISGINDKKEHAQELVVLLKHEHCCVNLIPYNLIYRIEIEPKGDGDANRLGFHWKPLRKAQTKKRGKRS